MAIFASSELGRLQMILESDTERCASEDSEIERGWTSSGVDWRRKRVATRTLNMV